MIGAVNMLVDISERKAAEEEKVLLLRELAHRVNNTFAVILAVAQQTLRTAPSSKAFVEIFSGRLQALAQAHNLLLTKEWTGADLGELAKGQLAPFCLEGLAAQNRRAQSDALSATSHRARRRAARARYQRREIWRSVQRHRQGQPLVDARTGPGGSCLGRASRSAGRTSSAQGARHQAHSARAS